MKVYNAEGAGIRDFTEDGAGVQMSIYGIPRPAFDLIPAFEAERSSDGVKTFWSKHIIKDGFDITMYCDDPPLSEPVKS